MNQAKNSEYKSMSLQQNATWA